MSTTNNAHLRILLLSLLVVFSLFLTACGSSATPTVGTPAAAAPILGAVQPTAEGQSTADSQPTNDSQPTSEGAPAAGTQQPAQSGGVDTGFRPNIDGFALGVTAVHRAFINIHGV